MCKQINYIVKNWKNITLIASLLWGCFGFLYILNGLPRRIEKIEYDLNEYKMARIPPRVDTLEINQKNLEREIFQIKADIQENNRLTQNTYDMTRELRDELIREAIHNGSKK